MKFLLSKRTRMSSQTDQKFQSSDASATCRARYIHIWKFSEKSPRASVCQYGTTFA